MRGAGAPIRAAAVDDDDLERRREEAAQVQHAARDALLLIQRLPRPAPPPSVSPTVAASQLGTQAAQAPAGAPAASRAAAVSQPDRGSGEAGNTGDAAEAGASLWPTLPCGA